MNIDALTVGQARELAGLFGGTQRGTGHSHSYQVGKCYLIRTVTLHFVGKIRAITDTDIVLDEASWVADTGRYGEALDKGVEALGESEFSGDGHLVARGGVIDAALWRHELPQESK